MQNTGPDGFLKACEKQFGTPAHGREPAVFSMVHAAFDYLPLAALIDESVLVLHGVDLVTPAPSDSGKGEGREGWREVHSVLSFLRDF